MQRRRWRHEPRRISRDLSSALSGVDVLGLRQADEGFMYWLYRSGQQLDNHPRGRIKGMLFLRRAILDFCPTRHDKDRVLALLNPRPVVAPINYRMTEEELRAEIQRNKAKARLLTAEQRRKSTEEQRRDLSHRPVRCGNAQQNSWHRTFLAALF